MGKTLVTGGSGFLGSHLVRALAERGDEIRLFRARRPAEPLAEIEFERATGEITDRRAVRARTKAPSASFMSPREVAATTATASSSSRQPRRGQARRSRRPSRPGSATGPHFHGGASPSGEAEGQRGRDAAVRDRPPRDRVRNSKHEAELGGVPARRPRAPRHRQPAFTLGPPIGRYLVDVDRVVRRFLQRLHPRLRRRRGSTSSTSATSPRASSWPTRRAAAASATSSAAATSPSQRLFADLVADLAASRCRHCGLPPRIAVGAAELSDPLPPAGSGSASTRPASTLRLVDLLVGPRPSASLASPPVLTRRPSKRRWGMTRGSSSAAGSAPLPAPPGALLEAVGRAGRGRRAVPGRDERRRTLRGRPHPLPDADRSPLPCAARWPGSCAGSGSILGPSASPTGAAAAPRSSS